VPVLKSIICLGYCASCCGPGSLSDGKCGSQVDRNQWCGVDTNDLFIRIGKLLISVVDLDMELEVFYPSLSPELAKIIIIVTSIINYVFFEKHDLKCHENIL
jgi:hypothetical protein